jgi:hypothetical protein
MGIWRNGMDGTDINSCDRTTPSHNSVIGGRLEQTASPAWVAWADDSGQVSLANYPCVVQHAPCISMKGHSSHVMGVRFTADNSRLISVGGRDQTTFQWRCLLFNKPFPAPSEAPQDSASPAERVVPPSVQRRRALAESTEVSARLRQAESLLGSAQYKKAASLLRQSLSLQPNNQRCRDMLTLSEDFMQRKEAATTLRELAYKPPVPVGWVVSKRRLNSDETEVEYRVTESTADDVLWQSESELYGYRGGKKLIQRYEYETQRKREQKASVAERRELTAAAAHRGLEHELASIDRAETEAGQRAKARQGRRAVLLQMRAVCESRLGQAEHETGE